MSYQHVSFAFDQAEDVGGTELIVLLALAHWANDDGYCWPSHDSIAKRARVSRRQVIRLLQSLVKRGILEVDQRRQYSNMYRIRCDIAMSDVTLNSDVTFGAPDVTFPASDVTFGVSRCDIAMSPELPIEQPFRTTTKNNQMGDAPKKAMPANGPVQGIVKAWYERAGFDPANYGKALGFAKQLHAANVGPGELGELYDWFAASPFWQEKGFDLGTCVSQLEKFRQAKRIPKTAGNGRASPTRGKTALEETMASVDEVFGRLNGTYDAPGEEIFETTGKVNR